MSDIGDGQSDSSTPNEESATVHEAAVPTEERPDDENGNFVDPELAADQMARRKRAQAVRGGVLGAAMLAVGEIVEPTKTDVSIEQAADSPEDDPLKDLDFGSLPPLD